MTCKEPPGVLRFLGWAKPGQSKKRNSIILRINQFG